MRPGAKSMKHTFSRAVFAVVIFALPCIGFAVESWPQFRGPNCSGISKDGNPPIEFGAKSNLVWKTELPSGHSSPCVMSDRIFLTGVDAGKLVTLGLDARTGQILWKRPAPAAKIEST